MTDKLEQAGRVFDPIEHSVSTPAKIGGFIAGVVVGVVVVVAATATAPVTITAAVVTVSTTATMGGTIAATVAPYFQDRYIAGDVETGANTVFVGSNGGRHPRAARVEDMCKCHDEPIATGVHFIWIEGKLATRADEETRCVGKLKKGQCSQTVWYGGPSVRVMPPRYHGEEPEWFFWTSLGASILAGRFERAAPQLMGLAAQYPRLASWFMGTRRVLAARSRIRGGEYRDYVEWTAAAYGALGDDESAAVLNDALSQWDYQRRRVTGLGVLRNPEPGAPIPTVDGSES